MMNTPVLPSQANARAVQALADRRPMLVEDPRPAPMQAQPVGRPRPLKAGGAVTRGDGCCMKGHTKGRMV